MAEKKNIDYSASAVNLCNPTSVILEMQTLAYDSKRLATLQEEAAKCVPTELQSMICDYQKSIADRQQKIRILIDENGSYQDLDLGLYAVKQRKVSISYDAARFKFLYPQYAPAIIIETVDTTKLKGLIKGGLLKEDELRHPDVAIAKETESFAYIVRV